MARAVMVITTMTGSYDTDGVLLTDGTRGFRDFDETNDMEFAMTGSEILLFTNINATSRTITIVSVADPFSRTGDLVRLIPQDQIVVFGPMQTTGFKNTSGLISVDGDAAGLEYIVLRP